MSKAKAVFKRIEKVVKKADEIMILYMTDAALNEEHEIFFQISEQLLNYDKEKRNQKSMEITYQWMNSYCQKYDLKDKLIKIQEEYIRFLVK